MGCWVKGYVHLKFWQLFLNSCCGHFRTLRSFCFRVTPYISVFQSLSDLSIHHSGCRYKASLHVNLTQSSNPIKGKKCSWQFLERKTALKNIKPPKQCPESRVILDIAGEGTTAEIVLFADALYICFPLESSFPLSNIYVNILLAHRYAVLLSYQNSEYHHFPFYLGLFLFEPVKDQDNDLIDNNATS